MDSAAPSIVAVPVPAAAPGSEDDGVPRWAVTERAARAADDSLAHAVAQADDDLAGDQRRRLAVRDGHGVVPIGAGVGVAPEVSPPAPDPSPAPAPPVPTRSPSAPASAAGIAAPVAPAAASIAPAVAQGGHDLRAWDDARPKQDDIGAWRWHDGGWRWEDGLDRHATPPAWSRPWFQPPTEDFRVPLDSALALRLFREDAAAARTIAPGVMANVAAAISRGDLAATRDAKDLVPLMQRMTVDHQLDPTQGRSALREHGAPVDVPPYAKRIARMGTQFEDGTNNHISDPAEYGGTNVAAMYLLMRASHDVDPQVPMPHYHGGVGNSFDWNPLMRYPGRATGAGMAEIQKKVRGEFEHDLASGITEFANVGFSRGSAGSMESVNAYVDAAHGREYHERFIGLFDTVSAMGLKTGGTGDLRLQPPRGEHAPDLIYHAVSQDERRTRFPVVDVGDAKQDHVIKDLFPGVHSDVGGGYANKGLSNITLHRMVENAQRAGVPMPSVEEVIATSPELAEKFHLVRFLHQDHAEARHFEDGFPFVQENGSRTLPADARSNEFPQAHIERHVESRMPVVSAKGSGHRWGYDAAMLPRVDVVEIEPSGRFRYQNADPSPRVATAPREPPPSRGDDDVAERERMKPKARE